MTSTIERYGCGTEVSVRIIIGGTTALGHDLRELMAALCQSAAVAAGLAANVTSTEQAVTMLVVQEHTELVAGLRRWRVALGSVPVHRPPQPAGLTALADNLMFVDVAPEPSLDDGQQEARLGELARRLLLTSPSTVLLTAADRVPNPGQLRLRVEEVVAPRGPGTVPPTAETATVHRQPRQRWVAVPQATGALVRAYRDLPPARDQLEGLARATANVRFGGVFDSVLIRRLRRRSGLSYTCSSRLTRRRGHQLMVVDTLCAVGSENLVRDELRCCLDDFAEAPLTVGEIGEALAVLRGRTLVDADSLSGRSSTTAARYDGSDPLALLEATADPWLLAAPADLARGLYRADELSYLILSPRAPHSDTSKEQNHDHLH